MARRPPHILIVGGYVGRYAAYRLQRKLRHGEATVTVVDPQPTMTHQPFLAEAAAGSVGARHVAVPLRPVLRGCRVVSGAVTGIDNDRKVATVAVPDAAPVELAPFFHRQVVAFGQLQQPYRAWEEAARETEAA